MDKPLKIGVVGGGPGGLYLAIQLKKANPAHEVAVYERNRADDTFGFAVVFSDETLAGFMGRDAPTYREITDAFAYWDEIEVRYRGKRIRSGGHGFCGISRIELLGILQRRAEELGVALHFETEVDDLARLADADLIVGSDGVNSWVRDAHAARFEPSIDVRKTKFVWLGSTLTFDAFTFIFRENEHGWHYLHAYRMGRNQFGETGSTWILECHEDTWDAAGFAHMSEAETVAYYEKMFADELGGHRLLANKSVWRNFPMVRCKRWHFDNVALIGDAAHTAQFSIGSGTKIAMEDAIALSDALAAEDSVGAALAAYEDARRGDIERLQGAAMTSLGWYENARRYNSLEPEQYVFNFLSRNQSVSYENLKLRDPAYGAGVDRWCAEKARGQGFDVPLDQPPPPMFTPFRIGEMALANRVAVSPMCQYSAIDGAPNDWHLAHLGSFAKGGAGLIFAECTGVSAEARITPGCTGLYAPEHAAAWRRVVDFVHANGTSRIGVQLGHSGSKGSTKRPWEASRRDEPLDGENWPLVAPTAEPFAPECNVPREMDRADMDQVIAEFVRAAGLADEAGFDIVELHMAHGYLLSAFLSPLMNRRADDYGGGLNARLRFPVEVLEAVRAAWPRAKPISVRISASDRVPEGGNTPDDAVVIARALAAAGADIIDVSSGGTAPGIPPLGGRMFQLPYSDQIRQEAGVPTIAVGGITTPDEVNTIIAAGRADICALARGHLADPNFTLHAAAHYGYTAQAWPRQYLIARQMTYASAEREAEQIAELRRAAKPPAHRRAAE